MVLALLAHSSLTKMGIIIATRYQIANHGHVHQLLNIQNIASMMVKTVLMAKVLKTAPMAAVAEADQHQATAGTAETLSTAKVVMAAMAETLSK